MRRMKRCVASMAAALGGALALALSLAPVAHAAEPAYLIPDAHPERGPALIQAYGCAACHTVPGVDGADGNVGPPLTRFGTRAFIAGMLHNQPGNLMRWIRDPQGVVPGNAMPDMGVGEQDARDIAAYLYTLR